MRNTSYLASIGYLVVVHLGHLLYIDEEGSDQVDIFFAFEGYAMVAFCTVGYNLDCYLEHSILGDSCSQVQASPPYTINS